MQVSSIDSLNPHSNVNASPELNTSMPLVGSVGNIDAKPHITSLVQDLEVAGTSKTVLHQLQGVEQSSQALVQEVEENQFVSVLRGLSEIDKLYYDENLTRSLIKNNDPKKYCYAELLISVLSIQAAWYRARNRALDLMHFIPLEKKQNVSKGKAGFAIAITHLINNKVKYQTCLNKIQSCNFFDLSDNTKKTNKELENEISRAKRALGAYRREYCGALLRRNIEESIIAENLYQCFSDYYSLEAIKKIFTSLSKEKIKALLQDHILSLSLDDKMEEHEFRMQRKHIPKLFWNSLWECSDQDWKAFNKCFFLFLLSSWLSEPEYLLYQKQKLKKAIATSNIHEEFSILTEKALQLSLRVGAQRILRQIIIFAKAHERLISINSNDFVQRASITANKQSKLNKINDAYAFIFTEIYLPCIKRKKFDWNVKTLDERQEQINLLDNEIYSARMNRKQLSCEDNLDAKRFLGFIYAVFHHFRDNYSIQLSDLNDIAARTITKSVVKKTRTSTNSLEISAQLSNIKRKVKHKRSDRRFNPRSKVSVIPSNVATRSEIAPPPLPLMKEMGLQQLLDDIQEVIAEDSQEVATQEQMLEHEEYRSILGSLVTAEGTESAVSRSILALIEEKRVQEYEHIPEGGLALPRLRFFPQMVINNEPEALSSSMLNFESMQQTVSKQEIALPQPFPKLFETTSVVYNIQESTQRSASALLDFYDLESDL